MSQNKDIRIQQKADLRNEWENNNPILLDQEIGFERNTGKFKMGDGLTPWNDLPYYLNIENGENNSIVLSSVENISGEMYVFFIKSIDMVNKKIYLCNEHQDLPEVSTNDYTDTTFSIEEYSVGDTFDLIVSATVYNKGRSHAHFVGTIENIEYNVITYTDTLPFNDLLRDTAAYSHSFFVSSKPRAGVYNISGYATAEGNYTIAAGPWSHAEGYGTLAAGRFAHAEGYDTRAGYGAHAEGQSTTAKGINSHAEGYATQANNNYAHAEGRETIASGNYGAHAEGYKSEATGNYAHAEGSLNKATGIGSHAEGYQTQAIQQTAHAEGYGSIASGIVAHAEGYNTQARGARAHTEGHHTYAFGDYAHSEGHSTKRIVSDIYDENGNILPNDKIIEAYNTSNFSLAKGIASHTEGSNNLALGDYSHAEGQVNIISSNLGHVEGYGNKVLGEDGHAEGRQNTASGTHSHAEGYQTTASGSTSHSEGHQTTASGIYSHTEGLGSSATSNSSHAEGYQTTSKAQGSHSEGITTTASAAGAHAEGSGTTASGNYAHAEGNGSTATTQSAHAEGQTCHATGQYGSHAEGFSAQARGQASHAENRATQAVGNFSHAEGEYTVANGLGSHTEGRSAQTATGADYSHAEGEYTIARGKSQHVQGKYNILDYSNKYAHIVGNGKAAEKDADGTVINPEVRSNAHTLDWEGNGWFAGNVSVGRNTTDEDNDLTLVTKGYLQSNNVSQTQQQINSLKYYNDIDLIPTDVSNLFNFEVDDTTMTATIVSIENPWDLQLPETIVVPYEYKKNNKSYQITALQIYGYNCSNWIFPNTLKYISMIDCAIKKLNIPNGVKTIGSFSSCFYVEEIVIPTSVETINPYGLTDMTNAIIYYQGNKEKWNKINIDQTNIIKNTIYYNWNKNTNLTEDKINKIELLEQYGDMNIQPSPLELFEFGTWGEGENIDVFVHLADMTYKGRLVIPYECEINNKKYPVTTLYSGFLNYSEATEIIIPKSIRTIETSCFRDSGLTKIPNRYRYEDFEFYNTKISSLKNLNVNISTRLSSQMFGFCENLIDVVVPDGITDLSNAFIGCSNLTSISLPKSISYFSAECFEGTRLSDIYYEGSEEEWKRKFGEDLSYYGLDYVKVHYKYSKDLSRNCYLLHYYGGYQNIEPGCECVNLGSELQIKVLTNSSTLYFPVFPSSININQLFTIQLTAGINSYITTLFFPRNSFTTNEIPENIRQLFKQQFINLQYIYYMNQFGYIEKYTL